MTRTHQLVALVALAALTGTGCPGPAVQPDTPTLPTGGAIPGDDPRPPGKGGGDVTPPPAVDGPLPQDLVVADEPFRAQQPPPTRPRPLNIPAIQTFVLNNGIRAYLVERHDLPVVTAEIVFDGGSMNDPTDKLGLASVCMELVSDSTQALDKIAYNEALADIASRIGSSAGREEQSVSMMTLGRHLDRTHALFVDTLLRPGLRPEDLDRMIRRRLDGIKQARGSAASVEGRVASSILFGAEHPFGRVTLEKHLQAITLDDCKAYHARWLKPQGARLFIAGDLTRKQVEQRFGSAALAGWTGKAPASAAQAAAKPRKGRIFFVNLPGAAQSEIRFMHLGPARTAPDYFANTLVSQILGGAFSSRLNMNLREDKGYSYGARGGFAYWRRVGELSAGSGVRSDSTVQSVIEIWNEMVGLDTGKKPPTADELAREKNGNILGLPGRFATMGQVLGAYRELVFYGLPLDHYRSYVARMTGVTAGQVTASAKKHLAPERTLILIVGDAESPQIQRVIKDGKKIDEPRLGPDGKQLTLLHGLRELLGPDRMLGAGELVRLDPDGVIIP